jgi:transposase
MGLARYVVEAVVVEGRSAREVARAHGISKSWIYELLARFRAGGYAALEPRSRRPRSCPHETPSWLVEEIVKLRAELERGGHDAGPQTIASHLARQHDIKLLIADRDIRIVDQHGQLIRQLTLDPTRNYQPLRPTATVHDVPRQTSGIT